MKLTDITFNIVHGDDYYFQLRGEFEGLAATALYSRTSWVPYIGKKIAMKKIRKTIMEVMEASVIRNHT